MTDMPEDNNAPKLRPQDDLAVFSTVVAAMGTLDKAGRIRLIRTLATFFDIPLGEVSRTPMPTTPLGSDLISSGTPSAGAFSENRAPSPKQFLLEKKPQTDVERITCLAYYLTHYRDQPQFKTIDLSKLNTEAAQIKFSNPTKAVDNAAQANFLVQAGQGRKQISAIGEVYVQALPDRAAARVASSELRNRRAKSKARTPKNAQARTQAQSEAAEDDGLN